MPVDKLGGGRWTRLELREEEAERGMMRGTQAKEGFLIRGERPDRACLQWEKATAKEKESAEVERVRPEGQLPEEQGASSSKETPSHSWRSERRNQPGKVSTSPFVRAVAKTMGT